MEIKPDRTNWKLFCEEPPLTKDEIAEWNEMASAIHQDDSLFDFISDETAAEWEGAYARKRLAGDWVDAVEWADANRALQRAEIRAYQERKKAKS